MRWPIYGLIACATLLLAASALGASRKDWTDCTQEVDPDRMIAGCTRVLNDRTVRNRAIAYVIRGLAWSAKNDFDHAITDYTEAIRLDPKNAVDFSSRGNAYYARRDYDHAIADYDQAIRLDPKNAVVFSSRGNAYYAKGDYDRAIADYDQAIRLDPSGSGSIRKMS